MPGKVPEGLGMLCDLIEATEEVSTYVVKTETTGTAITRHASVVRITIYFGIKGDGKAGAEAVLRLKELRELSRNPKVDAMDIEVSLREDPPGSTIWSATTVKCLITTVTQRIEGE